MKKSSITLLIIGIILSLLALAGCSSTVNDGEKEIIELSDEIGYETDTTVHEEEKKRTIYLTFDDGPSEYTEEILNILDKNGVKATFFVTADYEQYLPMIKEEYDRGHRVGIHAYLHKNVLNRIYNDYESSFNKMLEIIEEQTGSTTDIFRFPGGSSNTIAPDKMSDYIKLFSERGFEYYDWDVDSLDSRDIATKEIILQEMKTGVLSSKNYSMVLCHDIFKHTVDAIDEFIPWALENDFEFKIIDENTPEVHHVINTQ